jgi:hypothetical protein
VPKTVKVSGQVHSGTGPALICNELAVGFFLSK